MNKQRTSIDLVKLALYILKRIWLVIICAAIGFGYMYWQARKAPDTYTAYGTMFVTNSNPNLVNYGYASTADFSNAVSLVNVYTEVIKTDAVMDKILECRMEDGQLLSQKYPELTAGYIRGVVSMRSINETPMTRVFCTTTNPQLSADICNAVLQIAPNALFDIVGAGNAKAQDYATVPAGPNGRNDWRKAMTGAAAGAVLAGALLVLLFLLNRRVEDADELTNNYTIPVLASVRRQPGDEENPDKFLLNDQSEMDLAESYAKLRMNLLYTLVGKEGHTVLVTSAISGEGKSTITANLAISMAMSGKKVLLMDADMRRACQQDIFKYDSKAHGLSDILVGNTAFDTAVIPDIRENLDLLPAGSVPPNPSELLESQAMQDLLKQLEAKYDLILMDAPPVNIVSDPLALSKLAQGGLFVVRQHFSDHREIRKALIEAELTGLELLGFVFYGEKIHQGSYYSRYYHGYKYYRYGKYGKYGRYARKYDAQKYDTRSNTSRTGNQTPDK